MYICLKLWKAITLCSDVRIGWFFFLKSHRMMQGIQWEQSEGLVPTFPAQKTPFSLKKCVFQCRVHFEPHLIIVRNVFLSIRHCRRVCFDPKNYFDNRPLGNGHVLKKLLILHNVWIISKDLEMVFLTTKSLL